MKKQDSMGLKFLYRTAAGRALLKVLSARWLSKLAGAFCDSALSRPLIGPFIRKNGIDLSEYKTAAFSSFNDFFTREIKAELRPICMQKDVLISPCDGLLSAYKIRQGMVFPAKQSAYTLASLLRGPSLAEEFEGGDLLVFRLCVGHYHRYCYVDDGRKGKAVFIPGRLHTVRPIALESRAVFCENCREYTVLETENFGKLVQCEIGAMLVGKIQNHEGVHSFRKGQEKGMFLYGGSTVVLIAKKGVLALPERYFESTRQNIETPVQYGAAIGEKMSAPITKE